MDFAVSANDWEKIKESENRDKYQDFSGELKKLWSMKMTIIPIVIGAHVLYIDPRPSRQSRDALV